MNDRQEMESNVSEQITEEQLAEWEELASKATPGPWLYCGCGKCGQVHNDDADNIIADTYGYRDHEEPNPRKVDDAAFIAAARTAVPALIAELRECRRNPDGLVALANGLSRAKESVNDANKCTRNGAI